MGSDFVQDLIDAPEQARPGHGTGVFLEQDHPGKTLRACSHGPGVDVVDGRDFEGGQAAAGAERLQAGVMIGTEPVEHDRDA